MPADRMLLKSRDVVREHLRRQIAFGLDLVALDIPGAAELKDLEQRAGHWSQVNVEVLTQCFTGQDIVREYHALHGPASYLAQPLTKRIEEIHERITRWLSKLGALSETLDLFDEPSDEHATSHRDEALARVRDKVFVVYGRDEELRNELFGFLRAIGLTPVEWTQAVESTGKAAPYVGEVIEAGFAISTAAVVLFSPDDEARLSGRLQRVNDDEDERILRGQPRQNVLFEAGMALGLFPTRTVLVEIGDLRRFSDTSGRHVVRWDNSVERRKDLAQRLQAAGCQVDLSGTDWLTAGQVPRAVEFAGDHGRAAETDVGVGASTPDTKPDESRPRDVTQPLAPPMAGGLEQELLQVVLDTRFVDVGGKKQRHLGLHCRNESPRPISSLTVRLTALRRWSAKWAQWFDEPIDVPVLTLFWSVEGTGPTSVNLYPERDAFCRIVHASATDVNNFYLEGQSFGGAGITAEGRTGTWEYVLLIEAEGCEARELRAYIAWNPESLDAKLQYVGDPQANS